MIIITPQVRENERTFIPRLGEIEKYGIDNNIYIVVSNIKTLHEEMILTKNDQLYHDIKNSLDYHSLMKRKIVIGPIPNTIKINGERYTYAGFIGKNRTCPEYWTYFKSFEIKNKLCISAPDDLEKDESQFFIRNMQNKFHAFFYAIDSIITDIVIINDEMMKSEEELDIDLKMETCTVINTEQNCIALCEYMDFMGGKKKKEFDEWYKKDIDGAGYGKIETVSNGGILVASGDGSFLLNSYENRTLNHLAYHMNFFSFNEEDDDEN